VNDGYIASSDSQVVEMEGVLMIEKSIEGPLLRETIMNI